MALSKPNTASSSPASIVRYAESNLPTQFGMFRFIVYREANSEKEHCAIVKGDVSGAEQVLIRVHSECMTGEVLQSLKCDCRQQLDAALHAIEAAGRGVIVYLRQEGRGIGLGNKIRAYALQEQGHDTVDANRLLGFEDDLRSYEVASAVLDDLGVKTVAVLTNNPAKVQALQADGIQVVQRVPMTIKANDYNAEYLVTKRKRMGHILD